MFDKNSAHKYEVVIHRLRQMGGLRYDNEKNMAIANKAESILIDSGIVPESNRGAYIYIDAHVCYEGDLRRFIENHMDFPCR